MPFSKIRNDKAAPNLILVGNFGAGNVGDELILAGFLKKLRKELPRAKVCVLAGNPQLVRRFHGIDSLPLLPCGLRSFLKRGWWRSLRKIREADAVIFPGGGLFTNEESFRAILIWGLHLLIARYFWKPVYLLGQSIGPITGNYARKFTRFCLKKIEWIGVRDQASASELKRLGIPAKKVKLGRDTSFWLVNRIPKTQEIKKRGHMKILVSVRSFPKIEEKFFAEFAKALDKISERIHTRIFFAEFGKDDAVVWKKICRRTKNSKVWKTIELPESANEVIREVQKFDLVIGMRLHSLIIAKLAGIPAIGFAYSRKVKEFAEKSLEVENFSAEKLMKLLS
ncbi:polysaccharide pyruvyl transferase family protein [Candidatus Gracilibacteria bacterium]|nr:polysaccharide pyruvyl transferase family protein [Candidatus Gracilibacteria bacterium]